MKKQSILLKSGVIILWIIFLFYNTSLAQPLITGTWEGTFMKEFKTAILLDQNDDNSYTGKIIMFSGEMRIQDDLLSEISIKDRRLEFYIPAKETGFLGIINDSDSEISGNLTFPDQSTHPLTIRKLVKDSTALESSDKQAEDPLLKRIPVDDMKKDLLHLINKLREYHPRLYSYTLEERFEEMYEAILSGLDEELSMEQFYMRIAPLIELVKCSHTGIRLPRDYMEAVLEKGNFFPQKLFIRDMKAWYISTPGDPAVEIQAGSEIISINNRPMKEIIETLLSIIPSEGRNISTRYRELNQNFHTWYYLLDRSGNFDIAYSASGSVGHIQLDAVNFSDLRLQMEAEVPYSYSEKGSGSGILKISSFGIMDMDTYFAFLDSTFMKVKKSDLSYLVLDLRDNRGGHPIFAAQLFSYLTGEEFTWFRRNPDVAEFEPLYKSMQPNPLHYDGKIFVLVNGNCLSTTGHLISQLKFRTPALFIGEEPGSTYYCNDFSIQLELPKTGMEVNIPRTTFVTAVTGFTEGEAFPVDFKVNTSIGDILEEKDSYSSYANKLISDE